MWVFDGDIVWVNGSLGLVLVVLFCYLLVGVFVNVNLVVIVWGEYDQDDDVCLVVIEVGVLLLSFFD